MPDSELGLNLRALRATRLVWAALVGGTLAMAVVAYVVERTTLPLPSDARTLARVFAIAAAVVTTAASFVLPRLLPQRDDLTTELQHRQQVAIGAAAAQLGSIMCLVLYLATHDATDAAFALLPFVALLLQFPSTRALEATARRRR